MNIKCEIAPMRPTGIVKSVIHVEVGASILEKSCIHYVDTLSITLDSSEYANNAPSEEAEIFDRMNRIGLYDRNGNFQVKVVG
jgi:hypothetical protein